MCEIMFNRRKHHKILKKICKDEIIKKLIQQNNSTRGPEKGLVMEKDMELVKKQSGIKFQKKILISVMKKI